MTELMTILNYPGEIANNERWQEQALCTQVDPELWFPEVGQSPRNAKVLCGSSTHKSCPVREQCLEYALRNDIPYGIFGGFTARERTTLKRIMRRDGTMPLEPRTHCRNGHDLNVHGVDHRNRCRKCNENNRARRRDTNNLPHGRTRYNCGCRCETCTAANREYHHIRTARKNGNAK